MQKVNYSYCSNLPGLDIIWLPESIEGSPSQQQGDGRVLKIVYFLENCIGTNDWQCHDTGGRCCYVCCTKQDRKTYALRGISWYH